MFKGLGNLTTLLRQAQQIGARLQEVTADLKNRRAEGSAGAGMVTVEVNGALEVLKVKIDPQLSAQDDRELIEDLVAAATNDALAKARRMHGEAMQSLSGGIELPGLGDALAQLGGAPPVKEPADDDTEDTKE